MAPSYKNKRKKVWTNLQGLLELIDGLWVFFGDFNVIIDDYEKIGGKRGGSSTLSFFKELLFSIGAMDLGFTENSYTWSNKRWGADYIKQHLERDIANISWRLAFPKAAIYHLGALNSDHAPFLIDTNPQHPFTIRLFQFQAIWTRDSRCGEVISKAWEKDHLGSTCFNFYSKQFNTTSTLKIWNREVFGVCQIKINEFSVKLEEVQKRPANEFNARLEADIQAELNEWLLWNELM